jgi:hypothetical protein
MWFSKPLSSHSVGEILQVGKLGGKLIIFLVSTQKCKMTSFGLILHRFPPFSNSSDDCILVLAGISGCLNQLRPFCADIDGVNATSESSYSIVPRKWFGVPLEI